MTRWVCEWGAHEWVSKEYRVHDEGEYVDGLGENAGFMEANMLSEDGAKA